MSTNLEANLNANPIESFKKKIISILKKNFEENHRKFLLKMEYCKKNGHVEKADTKYVISYGRVGPKVHYICERCLMPQERNLDMEELNEWKKLMTDPFTV